jgi:hypothetical protein
MSDRDETAWEGAAGDDRKSPPNSSTRATRRAPSLVAEQAHPRQWEIELLLWRRIELEGGRGSRPNQAEDWWGERR